MAFDSVDEVLDFAILNEENAAQFYTNLANRTKAEHMRGAFLSFAEEERAHKAKLQAVKDGKLMLSAKERVIDLKIGDYLADVKPSDDLSYRQALIMAMKAEKLAFKLYQDLAAAVDDPGLKETFMALAQEEAKHKLRFEIEYDDYILKEG